MSDGQHGLQQSLVEGVSDATDLAGGGHVNAQDGVCLFEAGEAELGGLHAHVVQVEGALAGSRGLEAQHYLGGKFHQIDFQHL